MKLGIYVKLYGKVSVGPGCVIEDGVVIGHPSPAEFRAVDSAKRDDLSADELYSLCEVAPTYIGAGSIIRSGTVIYSGCSIGPGFDCAHHVLIRENVVIGSNVYVKAFSEIQKNVRIGNDCRLAGVVGDNSEIEDEVSSFGFLTHEYATRTKPGHPESRAPHLFARSVVGRGAVVIGGVDIGEDAVVGANTTVVGDVPAGALVVGVKGAVRERTREPGPPSETAQV